MEPALTAKIIVGEFHPSVTELPSLRCATTRRLGSGLIVLVVATPPVGCLVAALGGAVEPLIRAPQPVEAARVGGIGVVDSAVLERERAHAGLLPNVCGDVGASHGSSFGGPIGRQACGECCGRRPGLVIVFVGCRALLLLRCVDVEIGIEVAAE